MNLLNLGIVVGSKDLWDEIQSCIQHLSVHCVLEQRDIGDWGTFLEKMDTVRPDVLLVELSQLSDPLDDVVRQIKSTAGLPMVILVNRSAESGAILRAIRANADEYLYPPLAEDLKKAIERIAADRAKTHAGTKPRGKMLSFVSVKGGCGATTVACHLAVELAQLTKLEVLLADFDLESGIIGFLMKSQNRYTVLDAIENIHRLDLSFWKALVSDGIPGLEVISAPATPGPHAERPAEDFRNILRFLRSTYDWSLIDLGRGLTALSMALLDEIDECYLVTTLDIPALHQAKQMAQALIDGGFGKERLRLIINRVPKRTEVTSQELEGMIGLPVFANIPEDYWSLYEAYADGRLVPRKSHLGKAFTHLACRVSSHVEERHGLFSLLSM